MYSTPLRSLMSCQTVSASSVEKPPPTCQKEEKAESGTTTTTVKVPRRRNGEKRSANSDQSRSRASSTTAASNEIWTDRRRRLPGPPRPPRRLFAPKCVTPNSVKRRAREGVMRKKTILTETKNQEGRRPSDYSTNGAVGLRSAYVVVRVFA